MEIVKLAAGERAPEDADCISIQELPDGGYDLNGTVLLRCGDGDEAESVALIGGPSYPSYDEAEAAGLAWADGHCVELLHVSSSAGTRPLPDVV